MTKNIDIFLQYKNAKKKLFSTYFPTSDRAKKAKIHARLDSEWFIYENLFFIFFKNEPIEFLIKKPFHTCGCENCDIKIPEFISYNEKSSLKIHRNKNLENVGAFVINQGILYLLSSSYQIKDLSRIKIYLAYLKQKGAKIYGL